MLRNALQMLDQRLLETLKSIVRIFDAEGEYCPIKDDEKIWYGQLIWHIDDLRKRINFALVNSECLKAELADAVEIQEIA